MKTAHQKSATTTKQLMTLITWLLGTETGLSSMAIVKRYLGIEDKEHYYPQDSGDFKRCVNLLNSCPFINIKIMRDVSAMWRHIVDLWPVFTSMDDRHVYSVLNKIRDLIPADQGGLNQHIKTVA